MKEVRSAPAEGRFDALRMFVAGDAHFGEAGKSLAMLSLDQPRPTTRSHVSPAAR